MKAFSALFIRLGILIFLLATACIAVIQARVAPTTSRAGVVRDSSGAVVPNTSRGLVHSATQLFIWARSFQWGPICGWKERCR